MRKKIFEFVAERDLTQIDLELYDAAVEIIPTAQSALKAEFFTKKVECFTEEDGVLTIKQTKPSLFSSKTDKLKIYVPSHTTPDINVSGEEIKISVQGGIYGELNLLGDQLNAELNDCFFESAEIRAASVDAALSSVTAKAHCLVSCKKGGLLCENCLFAIAQFRVNCGNVGLTNFSCKDSLTEVNCGNVCATLDGAEEDFTFALTCAAGTSNRESNLRANAPRAFKAYVKKGNLSVDFTKTQQTAQGDF